MRNEREGFLTSGGVFYGRAGANGEEPLGAELLGAGLPVGAPLPGAENAAGAGAGWVSACTTEAY